MTAGPFRDALYLLLLLGKSFRADKLRTSTIYYQKETERRENRDRGRNTERGEKVFVWVEGERERESGACVCVCF